MGDKYNINGQELFFIFTFYLKHHRCYRSFIKYSVIKNYFAGKPIPLKTILSLIPYNSDSMCYCKCNIIMTSFTWGDTAEGHMFWAIRSAEWRTISDHLNIVDEPLQRVRHPLIEEICNSLIIRGH